METPGVSNVPISDVLTTIERKELLPSDNIDNSCYKTDEDIKSGEKKLTPKTNTLS